MTAEYFESILFPLKERFAFTDKQGSVNLLTAINRTYYIDDINYISIGDIVYSFWPLGLGNTSMFFYIRYFKEKNINGVIKQTMPQLHICIQTDERGAELLDDLSFLRGELNQITINAPMSVDVQKILSNLKVPLKREIPEDDYAFHAVRFVPTEETYILPHVPELSLRSVKEDSSASYEAIMATHPEIKPCYWKNSVKKRFVLQKGRDERENIESNVFEWGLKNDLWTLFKGEKPMMSLIPNVYSVGIMGFMKEHIMYSEQADEAMIRFVLKTLCCKYRDIGFVVRTVALFDDDPFESPEALHKIGMRADYRFVTLRKRIDF